MSDWFRSITALGAAFASVVVVTLALAALIVSGPTVVPQPSDAAGPVPAEQPLWPRTATTDRMPP